MKLMNGVCCVDVSEITFFRLFIQYSKVKTSGDIPLPMLRAFTHL